MSQPVFVGGVNLYGSTLTFQVDLALAAEQMRGNHDWTDEDTIDDCVVLTNDPAAGAVATQSGLLYVPRGTRLLDNRRFFYQGVWYGVRGAPRYNFNHVLTGEDFGYVEYTIVKGG